MNALKLYAKLNVCFFLYLFLFLKMYLFLIEGLVPTTYQRETAVGLPVAPPT